MWDKSQTLFSAAQIKTLDNISILIFSLLKKTNRFKHKRRSIIYSYTHVLLCQSGALILLTTEEDGVERI